MGNSDNNKIIRHKALTKIFASICCAVVVNCFCFYFSMYYVAKNAIATGTVSNSLIFFFVGIITLINCIYLFSCFHIAHVFARHYSSAKEETSELKDLSTKDKMTGAKNRSAYFEDMRNLSSKAEKNVGIVFCDLNGLKAANDNFGHEAGDALIGEAVILLTAKFNRPEDTIYRIGGDEFVVCRKNISQEDFFETVQLFIEALDEYPIMSVGEVWLDECHDIESQIKEADELMYQRKTEYYKKSGKDRRK